MNRRQFFTTIVALLAGTAGGGMRPSTITYARFWLPGMPKIIGHVQTTNRGERIENRNPSIDHAEYYMRCEAAGVVSISPIVAGDWEAR